MDTIIRVGGAAGDGVASTGNIVARAFGRLGYNVTAYNSYQSVIRGGHVWYNIRASEDPVSTTGDGIDILLAIDKLTAQVHLEDMREGGVIVHDEKKVDLSDLDLPKGVKVLPIPAVATAKELGSALVTNVVALGAVSHLAGLSEEIMDEVIEAQFGTKGEKLLNMNYDAIAKGREFAQDMEPIRSCDRVGDAKPLMTGNEALALGSLAAGLGFYAAYPMTPASSILHFLAKEGPDQGVLVKQMEDEIAVMNSTLGASYAGARAMCGTSGGGLALMTEAIGMAGMAELGVVIVNSMRGGPSTGLPTKTEQGDLWQMLGASQGEFPKVIIAPESPEDSYKAAVEAHEIADVFQVPVFLAMDFYLSETTWTVDPEDLPAVDAIERSIIDSVDDLEEGDQTESGAWKRFKDTPNGVSPRSLPGTPGLAFIAPSDEHDEHAKLISDVRAGLPDSLDIRNQQMAKRMRKLDHILERFDAPALEGNATGAPVLVCWGSTGPFLREAREVLAERGIETQQLTIRHVQPFQSDLVTTLLEGRDWIMVEANFTGQMQDLIRMRTGLQPKAHVRRYDGEPFTPTWLADEIEEVL